MFDLTKSKKSLISKGKSNPSHGTNKVNLPNADQDPVPKQTKTKINAQKSSILQASNRTAPTPKHSSRYLASTNSSKWTPSTSAPLKTQTAKCCRMMDKTSSVKMHCRTCQCMAKNMLVLHGNVLSNRKINKIIPENCSRIHTTEKIVPVKKDIENVPPPNLATQEIPHFHSPPDENLQFHILEELDPIESKTKRIPLNEDAPLQSFNHQTDLAECEEIVLAEINPEKESIENFTAEDNIPVDAKSATSNTVETEVPAENEIKLKASEEKISVDRFFPEVDTNTSPIPVEAPITETFEPITKSFENITSLETDTKKVFPREETVTKIHCTSQCHCISIPNRDENLINKDIIPKKTTSPKTLTTASLREILPVKTETEEESLQISIRDDEHPQSYITGKKPSVLEISEKTPSDELVPIIPPPASTHEADINISSKPTKINETGDIENCGCLEEETVNEGVTKRNTTEEESPKKVVAVDTNKSQIPVEKISQRETPEPILKSPENITPVETYIKEVIPHEETETMGVKCLQHCCCINTPNRDKNLINEDILPKVTTGDNETPKILTASNLGKILPVEPPNEESSPRISTPAPHEVDVNDINSKPTEMMETGDIGNCGCLPEETFTMNEDVVSSNKTKGFPVGDLFIQSSEVVVAVDEYSTERILDGPHQKNNEKIILHNGGDLEIGEKGFKCVSEQCLTEANEQKAICCPSLTNKSILKLELDKGDKPDEYLVLHGPMFVRKSILGQSSTPESIPQKIEATESDTVKDFLKCKKCCREGKCVAKELLHICESDPEGIIEMYRSQIIELPHIKEEDLLSDTFQMQKTHGEVYGDPKYHFLMVDKSISVDEMMLGEERNEELPEEEEVEEKEEIIEEKKSEEETFPEIEMVDEVETQVTNAEEEPVTQIEEVSSLTKSVELSKESVLEDNEENVPRHSTISWGQFELQKPAPITSDESVNKVAEETRRRREKFMGGSFSKKKKNSTFEDILKEVKSKNTPLTLDVSSKNVTPLPSVESVVQTKCCGLRKKNKKMPHDHKWSRANRKSTISHISRYEIDPDVSMTSVQYPSKPTTETNSDRSSLDSYRRRSSPVENPVFEEHKRLSKYLSNI